jgi:hypothetical protein
MSSWRNSDVGNADKAEVVGLALGETVGAVGFIVGAAVGLQCVGVTTGGPSNDRQLPLKSMYGLTYEVGGGKYPLGNVVNNPIVK